ncbi:MAG: HlyC/CorC family transporter [Caldilineaceae bacterium]|nr:HlyC/CorC family transporter [Caldilineaceae bacterium]MCB0141729.1 HlyC/CorC family transporter [Caldilineaceae bacterium]
MLESDIGRLFTELLAILLLLSLNGLFALSEIAIVSAKRVRLEQLALKDARARRALRLADEPTNFLSTVQIGITLIGILAGALSGATLSSELAALLENLPFLAPYADASAFVITVMFVTYLSLVIGELIPKSIALSNPERFALSVAPLMDLLALVTGPIVKLLSWSTEGMLRLLRVQPNQQPPVTEEELKILLAEGANAGVFEPLERHIVTQALELDDIALRPLLTHRTHIHWLDVNDSPEMVRQKVRAYEVNVFPVCQGRIDNVVGVVHVRDLLLALDDVFQNQTAFELMSIAQSPIFVPLSAKPSTILLQLSEQNTQIIFVLDEYGGIQGIITQADILQSLLHVSHGDERRAFRE